MKKPDDYKPLAREDLVFDASCALICLRTPENACLGDLMHFEGRGVYDPGYGRVPVTPEEAEAHNKVLNAMRLEGLDKNCEIGQGGFAYYGNGKVTDFIGAVIAAPPHVRVSGQTVTFTRGARVFRGRLRKNEDAFNFRRVL